MKFWQMVTWSETEQYVDIARSAEACGFHGVMNADHAFYPQHLTSPYPYSEDGKPPMGGESEYPDPWVSIAQMAAVTSTLCFSTSVYILPLRNPIEVAKATASLALMSGNRFMLGAGIGWMKEEYDTYGLEFRQRGARYDECLDALQLLWRGDWCEYHGEHIDFDSLRILPVPAQPVPVYLGGSSPAALRRIARRADGMIGNGNSAAELPELMEQLRQLRREAGREHLPFETIMGVMDAADLDTYKRLYDAGVTASVNLPFPFTVGWGSGIHQKREQMQRFAEDIVQPMADYGAGRNL